MSTEHHDQKGSESTHTSDKAASDASHVMRDGRTSDDSKSAAASALSQVQGGTTSDEVASTASKVLTDDETGPRSKSAAASALSQASSSDESEDS